MPSSGDAGTTQSFQNEEEFAYTCSEPIMQELNRRLGRKPIEIQLAKSAQQKVFIVHYDPTHTFSELDRTWQDALECGRNRLVIRCWQGGSRWWNLNRPTSPQLVARSEIAGYRTAYKALPQRIPRALAFFDCQSSEQANKTAYSWAILEYVGPNSKRHSSEDDSLHYDAYWITSMIKIREEFGFAEPHPRWGRVPVDNALQYARLVLRDVTIPIHKWFFTQKQTNDQYTQICTILEESIVEDLALDVGVPVLTVNNKNPLQKSCHSYSSMLHLYEQAHGDLQMNYLKQSPWSKSSNDPDTKLRRSLELLGKCIQVLRQQSKQAFLQPLPFVLVHMDCQPQNLMIAKDLHSEWHISAVLDWEEAALADPRFELLLLGRKVCANTHQAKDLWEHYQDEMTDLVQLGPIEPWLRLETVHSLTTLLLQAMNQGGRSPWEKKPDLWGKIHREFQRLAIVPGWAFCGELDP